ncbi:WecB/TagA/CpsF family glycosyltransferase [Kitasatospora sp. GP82]|uniref:WecB/TagA/CpsF family glycosyltransferase n=1 Tax=Kitasatospora sp. GP82 TaxID=3035089 RepID=UPI00247620EC|nr:WecB/TagA/CpsF family glycosyltransferase [Kitasatospora sp. GP82]MDH6123738.1 N-acetylglucosaminyldiphosphoundecaprenol N-acetyl-beta-D-mannosaminyltransferase [Kitasatospora sp. GP82]
MKSRESTTAEGARDLGALMDRIRIVDDEAAERTLLDELVRPGRPFVLSFVNAHAVNLGWHQPDMTDGLFGSDLLLRDGLGMKLGMRVFGRPYGRNMNGTDFIPKVGRAYRGKRVALFGTRSPWLDNARRTLEAWGLTVVASQEGFDPPESYVRLAAATKPDLILLAMGMPKQEAVSVKLREALSHPVLIVNGGAVLDHLGGKVPRAPLVMRRTGTEWLFRLAVEPRRLFGRYVIGIPVFCSRMARVRLSGGSFR